MQLSQQYKKHPGKVIIDMKKYKQQEKQYANLTDETVSSTTKTKPRKRKLRQLIEQS